MPRLASSGSLAALAPADIRRMLDLDAVASGPLAAGTPQPALWAEDAAGAAQDVARMLAVDVGIARGIPLEGGQLSGARSLLETPVSPAAIRAAVGAGPVGDGLDDLLDFTRSRLGPALRDAMPGVEDMVGRVASATAGAVVPVVGSIVSGWVRMFTDAAKWRRPVQDPLNPGPTLSVDQDLAQARAVMSIAGTGNLTALFLPPGHPTIGAPWPSWSLGYGELDIEPNYRQVMVGSIGWTGYGTGVLGSLVHAGRSFGGHPRQRSDGSWEVTVHRGVVTGTAARAREAGSSLPATAAALGQAWAMLANPHGPVIWTVYARQLHDAWVDYLAGLRRCFHLVVSTGNGAIEAPRNTPAGRVLATLEAEKTGSKASKLPVKSQHRLLRKRAVDELADVLGWPAWSGVDDMLLNGVAPLGSLDWYRDAFDLRACHAPRAMRWLAGQQRRAAKTVSAAYARESDWSMLHDHDLRRQVERTRAAMPSSRAARYVDLELVADAGLRASLASRQTSSEGERVAAAGPALLVGSGGAVSTGGPKGLAAPPVGPALTATFTAASTGPSLQDKPPPPRREFRAQEGDESPGPAVAAVGGLALLLLLLL